MSRKEREACERKNAASLKAAEAAFPEEKSESAGTDSSSSDREKPYDCSHCNKSFRFEFSL